MTADEARTLDRGVIVYYGADATDRGVVVDLTIDPDGIDVIWILWGTDRNASKHRVSTLARIHRWYRGLSPLEHVTAHHTQHAETTTNDHKRTNQHGRRD